MLPMSPQQQFELAKQVAISNPSRLQAVLRGQPDPVFSDLNIAMMALRGAADLRKSMEGAQAAQQTQQPSVKDQMVAQMDQETAQLGGVANLQAPNMAIPNGGVAGEEEPPVVQAAGGGAVKRFNGQFGSEVPESTLGKWWRGFTDPRKVNAIGSPAAIDPRVRELFRKRAELAVPFYEAVTPSERSRRERELQDVDTQIRALQTGASSKAPAAELSPSNIGGADVSGGMYESVFSRLEPKAGSAQFPSSSSLVSSTPPPLAPRAAPEAASKAAPIVAAAPQKDGIARLYGDPKSVFADIDSIPDPAKREEVRRAYMEQLRTQGVLQEPKTGVDTLTSSFDPASVRTQIEAARKRSLEDARAATAPQWEAVQKLWSKDEANQEEKLSALEKEKRGLAALAAAEVLGEPGQTGMRPLSRAFGAVGGVGAKYGAEKRKLVQNFNDAKEKQVLAGLAYEQGNYKLATSLADQEQKHVEAAAKIAYDVEYQRAIKELEGRKLTELERSNLAKEAADNKKTRVLMSHYDDMRLQYSAADKNAQRAALQGQLTSLAALIRDPMTPKEDKAAYISHYNAITKQLASMAGLSFDATRPPPSDFSDKLPPGAKVSGSLVN